jgi:hypothetical protein
MEQSENSPEMVCWDSVQGNKLIKALHPAMLSSSGCLYTSKIRLIGKSKWGGEFATLIYDRKYVIAWLSTKLIAPFQNEGLDTVLELVKEAWESVHQPKSFQSKIWQKEDEQI